VAQVLITTVLLVVVFYTLTHWDLSPNAKIYSLMCISKLQIDSTPDKSPELAGQDYQHPCQVSL